MAKSNILKKLNPATPSKFVKYIEQNIGDLDGKQFSNEDLAYVISDEFFDSNVDGYKDLKTLSKGIYENLDSTYKQDLERLFQTNFELKQLIENLENSKKAENDK